MKITPIKYAIHREEESPIFGEQNTFISIEDEGGGTFVTLSQCVDEMQQIRLDWSEVEFIFKQLRKLRK